MLDGIEFIGVMRNAFTKMVKTGKKNKGEAL